MRRDGTEFDHLPTPPGSALPQTLQFAGPVTTFLRGHRHGTGGIGGGGRGRGPFVLLRVHQRDLGTVEGRHRAGVGGRKQPGPRSAQKPEACENRGNEETGKRLAHGTWATTITRTDRIELLCRPLSHAGDPSDGLLTVPAVDVLASPMTGDFVAAWLPSVFVPLVGLLGPAVAMALLFNVIEASD